MARIGTMNLERIGSAGVSPAVFGALAEHPGGAPLRSGRRDADRCNRDGRAPQTKCALFMEKGGSGTRWNASLPG